MLLDYLRCPLRFYFRRVLRLPAPNVPAALVLGSAVHAALAEYHRGLREQEWRSAEAIAREFLSEWKRREAHEEIAYRDGETRDATIEVGLHLVAAYLKEPAPEGIVTVESELLVPLRNSAGEYSPAAASILETTRGVIFYQEQVMRLLKLLAGIEFGEGYRIVLRAAWGDDRQRTAIRDEILSAARSDGRRPSPSLAVIDELLNSCRYAACQAHHLGEALLVCQAAWVRREHPDVFEQAIREAAATS